MHRYRKRLYQHSLRLPVLNKATQGASDAAACCSIHHCKRSVARSSLPFHTCLHRSWGPCVYHRNLLSIGTSCWSCLPFAIPVGNEMDIGCYPIRLWLPCCSALPSQDHYCNCIMLCAVTVIIHARSVMPQAP
jgi:hypothetical protein